MSHPVDAATSMRSLVIGSSGEHSDVPRILRARHRLSHLLVGFIICMMSWGFANLALPQETSGTSNPDLLEVGTPRLGLDGTVRELTFLPLNVEVRNRSSAIWQGTMTLYRGRSPEDATALPLKMELLLQGDETRIVQFTPLFVEDLDSWTLVWGPEKSHRISISAPRRADRTIVLIDAVEAVSSDRGTMRRMPADHFPLSVTGTDGLDAVLLDAIPFWQGARAQAFRDWLFRGGQVILLHDHTGRYPVFPAPLEFLNIEGERAEFGRGKILRRPQQANEVSANQLQEELFPAFRTASPASAMAIQARNQTIGNAVQAQELLSVFLNDRAAFHRPWLLIYLFVLAYLLALFPGCYLIGRNSKHVRSFYAAFLSTSAAFSVIFMLLGQLGGQEQNRIRTLAIAEPLENGAFDVSSWSRIAAARGGDYQITHSGMGVQYSADQYFERRSGEILAGRAPEIRLSMPPASFQSISQRARVTIPDRRPPVVQKSEFLGEQLDSLTIEPYPPIRNRIIEAFAIYRGVVYPLDQQGGVLTLNRIQSRKTLARLGAEASSDLQWGLGRRGTFRMPRSGSTDDAELESNYTGATDLLLLYGWELYDPRMVRERMRDDSSLWIATLEELPDELRAESESFPDQTGAVLFLSRHRVSP